MVSGYEHELKRWINLAPLTGMINLNTMVYDPTNTRFVRRKEHARVLCKKYLGFLQSLSNGLCWAAGIAGDMVDKESSRCKYNNKRKDISNFFNQLASLNVLIKLPDNVIKEGYRNRKPFFFTPGGRELYDGLKPSNENRFQINREYGRANRIQELVDDS